MVKEIQEYLSGWLQLLFKEADYADCFLVEIKVDKQKERIQIWLDADDGLSLNRCAKINRSLSNKLEEMGENYALEISSPGLDRPLILLRQRKKNIGRLVKVKRVNAESIEGTLQSAATDAIVLKSEIPSKKRKKEYIEHTIEVAQIEAIYVLPQFNKKQ